MSERGFITVLDYLENMENIKKSIKDRFKNRQLTPEERKKYYLE